MITAETEALRAGATHAECLEILAAGGPLYSYVMARQAGATHDECLEILMAGGTLGGYGWIREAGATHAECLEVIAGGGPLYSYAVARWAGATHAECLVLVKAICLEPQDFAVVLEAYRELAEMAEKAQSTPTVLEVLCGLGGADWTQGAHALAVAALACAQ